MRRRSGRLEAPALVDRDVHQDRAHAHLLHQGVGDQPGGAGTHHEHRPDDDVGIDADLLDGVLGRRHGLERPAEVVVDLAQPVEVPVEHVDVGVHADRQRRCRHARHAGAEDDHPGRPHAGYSGDQHAAAAARAHQMVRPHDRRHPTRHLAHGRQEGK